MATHNSPLPAKSKGFTLIELVITVTILGLLSAIAVPAYSHYIHTSRRSEAVNTLIIVQQMLENCRTNSPSRTYKDCLTLTGKKVDGLGTDYYDVEVTYETISGVDNAGYTLEAIPRTGTSQADDTNCASFTIKHNGERDATNDYCWK